MRTKNSLIPETDTDCEAWDEQMAEKERLNPGFHDRFFDKLLELYPRGGVDADTFFASE